MNKEVTGFLKKMLLSMTAAGVVATVQSSLAQDAGNAPAAVQKTDTLSLARLSALTPREQEALKEQASDAVMKMVRDQSCPDALYALNLIRQELVTQFMPGNETIAQTILPPPFESGKVDKMDPKDGPYVVALYKVLYGHSTNASFVKVARNLAQSPEFKQRCPIWAQELIVTVGPRTSRVDLPGFKQD